MDGQLIVIYITITCQHECHGSIELGPVSQTDERLDWYLEYLRKYDCVPFVVDAIGFEKISK